MNRSRRDGPRSVGDGPAPRPTHTFSPSPSPPIAPRSAGRSVLRRPPGDRAGVLAWLDSRVNYEQQSPSGPGGGGSFGLGRMRRLLSLLGDPHRAMPVIHVAGTKGKGSTVAMLAAVLERSGLRVGRYLSPHVHRIEERICVDSRPIAAAALVRSFAAVIPAVARLDASALRRGARGPTWFEAVTAAAFDHFRRERVDIAVLETGLGGRLDATNVCRPLVSVITPVSLDHTAVLGPTVRHIAAEKAGIIKRGRPVVCGARDPAACAVIESTARRRRSPLLSVDRDFTSEYVPPVDPENLSGGTLLFSSMDPPRAGARRRLPAGRSAYALAMTGRHQADNAALAVAAVHLLRGQGYSIPEAALCAALATNRLPARIERVGTRPLVVVDAAHNVASMRSLVEALAGAIAAARAANGPAVLVFAASSDKDIEAMLGEAAGHFDRVVVTRATSGRRGAAVERVAAAATSAGIVSPVTAADPGTALGIAKRLAGPRGMVCIAGSFFLAGDLRQGRRG